tara:strand:- start:479 stop:757 length:279 start_codon:yes stop_codon:yes gene_type:complete
MTADHSAEIPAIDVRTIPRHERHPRIFSMLEALEPGQAFAVVSDHEPRPLQDQTEARFPDVFGWTYVEQGPEVWRAVISREAASCCGCCGGS